MRLWSTLWALACVALLQAQNAPKAPNLPENVVKSEQEQLTKAINLLSKGEFAEAERLIKPTLIPNVIRIYGSWATILIDLRESFRTAAEEAVAQWNRALGGTPYRVDR